MRWFISNLNCIIFMPAKNVFRKPPVLPKHAAKPLRALSKEQRAREELLKKSIAINKIRNLTDAELARQIQLRSGTHWQEWLGWIDALKNTEMKKEARERLKHALYQMAFPKN